MTLADGATWAGTGVLPGAPHRSPEFARLMFDALDNAFGALGHPEPIDHLRRQAAARRAAMPASDDPAAQMAELSYDFATDILMTASHYAALLEAVRRQARPEAAGGMAGDGIAA